MTTQALTELWYELCNEDHSKPVPDHDRVVEDIRNEIYDLQNRLAAMKEMRDARKIQERNRWGEVVSQLREILIITEGHSKR